MSLVIANEKISSNTVLPQIDGNQNNLRQDAIPISNTDLQCDDHITRPLSHTSDLSDSLLSLSHVSLSSLESEGKGLSKNLNKYIKLLDILYLPGKTIPPSQLIAEFDDLNRTSFSTRLSSLTNSENGDLELHQSDATDIHLLSDVYFDGNNRIRSITPVTNDDSSNSTHLNISNHSQNYPFFSNELVNTLSLQKYCILKGIGSNYPKFKTLKLPNNIWKVTCQISGNAEIVRTGQIELDLKETCAAKMHERLYEDFDNMVNQYTPLTQSTTFLRTVDNLIKTLRANVHV